MLRYLRQRRDRRLTEYAATFDASEEDVNVRAEATHVLDLVRGTSLPTSSRRSLLFFAMHRGGSSFVGSMLASIADRHQVKPINLEAHHFNYSDALFEYKYGRRIARSLFFSQRRRVWGADRVLRDLFRPTGYYYGPLRDPTLLRKIPHVDQFAILLLLRDPRDVVTSLYYSVAHSHVLPDRNQAGSDKLLHKRRRVRSTTIDDYVRRVVPEYLHRYQIYLDLLRKRANITLLRYEDMVLNFGCWLDEVCRCWQIRLSEAERREWIMAADFTVKREDPSAHKRQVLPGDHRRKLQPETIDQLNESFAKVLAALDYPLDVQSAEAA